MLIVGIAGGTGSAVIDAETGFRVDGESVDEIASAIKRLITDKDVYMQMSDRAYARVKDEFSWEAVARKTISLSENG